MLARRMLGVTLLATACTAGGAGQSAKGQTERVANGKAGVVVEAKVEAPQVPAKVEAPAASDVPVAGKREVRVKVGQTLVETVSNPRNPVDASSWSAEPTITGTAVTFLERAVESPPPDVDGGSHTFRYRFAAVEPGRAKVSFSLTSPESKDPIEAVSFMVVVGKD